MYDADFPADHVALREVGCAVTPSVMLHFSQVKLSYSQTMFSLPRIMLSYSLCQVGLPADHVELPDVCC